TGLRLQSRLMVPEILRGPVPENLRSPEREVAHDAIGSDASQAGAIRGDVAPAQAHEIQVLLRAGHSHSDVATRTGVSLDTVARVKREDGVIQGRRRSRTA
ncbi:MAG: hypothetical protein ACRENE_05060, partial [Polyangiaceae bacterium]